MRDLTNSGQKSPGGAEVGFAAELKWLILSEGNWELWKLSNNRISMSGSCCDGEV